MKNTFVLFLVILLSLLMPYSAYNQTEEPKEEKPKTFIITMNNGDEYEGTIIEQGQEFIVLETVNGRLQLIAANISYMQETVPNKKFRIKNYNHYRYFLTPSAIPLKKRTGRYRNINLTTNSLNYGITNNLSVGGGFELISALIQEPIWFLTTKYGFRISDNLHGAGGVFMIRIPDGNLGSLAYGMITLGDSNSNISLGTGAGIFNWSVSPLPIIVLSGTHRLTNSLALVSENFIGWDDDRDVSIIGIPGFRIMFNDSAIDISALLGSSLNNSVSVIPYLGYSLKF